MRLLVLSDFKPLRLPKPSVVHKLRQLTSRSNLVTCQTSVLESKLLLLASKLLQLALSLLPVTLRLQLASCILRLL
jgi:hypothetical protein